MNCDCTKYAPLELIREAITKRIKETPDLKKRLVLLSKNDTHDLDLYRCPACSQFWQTGHEWNFGNKEYIFQVPHIELEEWTKEPYAQPAAMLIYSAVMQDFMARNKFEASENACKATDCREYAVKMSTFCLKHHIDSLQKARLLPPSPAGRMFAPYHFATTT